MKPGGVLAPTLFALNLAAVLDTVRVNLHKWGFIYTRRYGKLFNLACLYDSIKVGEVCVMWTTWHFSLATLRTCNSLWTGFLVQ